MDKMELIEELNSLSDRIEKDANAKARAIEIAKILLKEHYWYSRSEKDEIKKFADRLEKNQEKNTWQNNSKQ